MTTEEQKRHLKRGSVKGEANTAAATAKAAANRRQDRDLFEIASEDPDQALLELFANLTVGLNKLMRKWIHGRGNVEPPRVLIETAREFRQLTEPVRAIIKARGATTEAEQFFAGLEARLAEANLEEGPQPIHALDRAGAM